MIYLLIVLLVAYVQGQYLDPGVQTNVATASFLANLQPCYTWNSLNPGPTISDIVTYCPGEVYYSCISAVDSSKYSIVAHGPFNDTLALPIGTTVVSPNGAPFFRTSTSIGIGSSIAVTNCSQSSDPSSLCWNVNSTTTQIGIGGWCGPEGYQSQVSVFFGIFSLPCLNSTAGSACTVPGVGLCNTGATCNANYTCSGGTNTPPLMPNSSSCWTAPFCNPMTGVYDKVNTTAGISCSINNPCSQFMVCDGMQNCIGGISPCIPSNNTCLSSPNCTAINSTAYTCDYPFNNVPCIYDSGWLCRQNDTCINGVCTEGIPLEPPVLDYCQVNATCNITTGTFDYVVLPDYTNCTIPQNLCLTGFCLSGWCSNLTMQPSPFANLSVCLTPVCNPANGTWFTQSAQLPGQACSLPDPCSRGFCLVNGTCANFGTVTCQIYPNVPCLNTTCVPGVGCTNFTLTSGACNLDGCNLNGTCSSNGTCLGTTLTNCTSIQIDNPFCAYAACDPSFGCYTAYFNSSVSCPNPCYVNGTGFCTFGVCQTNVPQICTSSDAFRLTPWNPFGAFGAFGTFF